MSSNQPVDLLDSIRSFNKNKLSVTKTNDQSIPKIDRSISNHPNPNSNIFVDSLNAQILSKKNKKVGSGTIQSIPDHVINTSSQSNKIQNMTEQSEESSIPTFISSQGPWDEYQTSEGDSYYFNRDTNQTQWELPDNFITSDNNIYNTINPPVVVSGEHTLDDPKTKVKQEHFDELYLKLKDKLAQYAEDDGPDEEEVSEEEEEDNISIDQEYKSLSNMSSSITGSVLKNNDLTTRQHKESVTLSDDISTRNLNTADTSSYRSSFLQQISNINFSLSLGPKRDNLVCNNKIKSTNTKPPVLNKPNNEHISHNMKSINTKPPILNKPKSKLKLDYSITTPRNNISTTKTKTNIPNRDWTEITQRIIDQGLKVPKPPPPKKRPKPITNNFLHIFQEYLLDVCSYIPLPHFIHIYSSLIIYSHFIFFLVLILFQLILQFRSFFCTCSPSLFKTDFFSQYSTLFSQDVSPYFSWLTGHSEHCSCGSFYRFFLNCRDIILYYFIIISISYIFYLFYSLYKRYKISNIAR